MPNRDQYLSNIRYRLSVLATEIKLNSKVNRQNANISAEDICGELLNRVYGYRLVNVNSMQQNQKSVDLIDTENSVAVQVTSSNSKSKIAATIRLFCSGHPGYRLCEKYATLIVMLTTDNEKFSGWKDIPTDGFTLRILNFKDISAEVEHFPVEELSEISDFLNQELGESSAHRNHVSPPTHKLPSVPPLSQSYIPGSREKELSKILPCVKTGKPVYIWGLGGIGKTQVAIELAKRLNPRKGAFFLHYVVPGDKRKEAMRETILRANFSGYHYIDEPDYYSEDESAQQKKSEQKDYLNRLDILRNEYEGALLIIDNFDCPEKTLADLQSEQSFYDLLQLGIMLVFTTRCYVGENDWWIGPISDNSLLQLMRRHYRNTHVADWQLMELIRSVDGHTMTVDLIAKTLEKSWGQLMPADMLQAIKQRELNRQGFHLVVSDHNHVTQKMIYDHLRTLFDLSEMNGAMWDVLRYASVLPEDGMDAKLFFECIVDPRIKKKMQAYVPCQDAVAVINQEQREIQEERQRALYNLVDSGWLSRDEKNVLSIHPVIRELCWIELKPNYATVGIILDNLWSMYDPIKDGIDVFRKSAKAFIAYQERLANAQHECGYRLQIMSQYITALRCILYYRSNECMLANDHIRLANYYRDAGRFSDALSHREKALALYDKKHEKQNSLSSNYFAIGALHRSLGGFSRAIESVRNAVNLQEKKRYHRNLLIPYYIELAELYLLTEAPENSIVFLKKALEISQAIFIPEHPDYVVLYRNLGVALCGVGEFEDSMACLQKALSIAHKSALPSKADIIEIGYCMGYVKGVMGQYGEALQYLENSLEKCSEYLPLDHPLYAEVFSHFAIVFCRMKQFSKAAVYAQKTLCICEKVYPCTHWRIAMAYAQLGYIYRVIDQKRKALAYLQMSLVILEKENDSNYPLIRRIRNDISDLNEILL